MLVMLRFLTPIKVVLLALTLIYTEGFVAASATVRVLSFLTQHILPTPVDRGSVPATSKLNPTIQEFQGILFDLQSGVPGRTIWDLLLKRLWQIESFDALQAFFDSLGTLLAKSREQLVQDRENGVVDKADRIRLSRPSPLGAFVRRAQVEFTRLQLHDAVALWKSFTLYREPTRSMWRRRNPNVPKAGFDINLAANGDSMLNAILYRDANKMLKNVVSSSDDVDSLLEFQVERMQSMSLSTTLGKDLLMATRNEPKATR